MIRNCVTFKAEFPDDGVWSEHGQPIVPDGKAIANAISTGLMSVGLKCSDPQEHSFYGWEFEVKSDDICVSCLLQNPDPWLLMTEIHDSFINRFLVRNRDDHQRKILGEIHRVLENDRRFSAIKWLTEQEFDRKASGSETPY